MLLLDLSTVPPRERPEAFRHALTDSSVPNDVFHEEPDTGMHARMHLWRVGGLDLFATRNSGFEVRRTERHVHHHRSHPVVSVSLQPEGVHRAEVGGRQRLLGADDICVFHELSVRTYGWSGDGTSHAMLFDMNRLGVPVETVVRASQHLSASPMHGLVLDHLRSVFRDAGRLENDPGAEALGTATTELVRALLLSAAHAEDAEPVRSVMDDTLLTRVMAYARRHLADRALTPERIAAEHAISVRRLYLLLSEADVSLEQWLITERLTKARQMLGSPRYDRLTVAALAARCGFSSPSHFTRRFQAAYGVTPSEWRRHRGEETSVPGA
ncbi:Transcriptional regulator [Streptomyces davaonensis JCM 4913]|uniref:Transcriptional regulator n=1 Tax=Streptomyces davaonensis (strain DSM 101723 / JCM 4913 / KCC S-0913 / 768) TaxID=1214101 RepID=K4QXT4_STRDJ|nr:helix-turn-helix domain-containing protein [Streptomyces davaonensis]CCK25194.1 Transcriptional regulator [Streptomyces davaonensis JCM 4913]